MKGNWIEFIQENAASMVKQGKAKQNVEIAIKNNSTRFT